MMWISSCNPLPTLLDLPYNHQLQTFVSLFSILIPMILSLPLWHLITQMQEYWTVMSGHRLLSLMLPMAVPPIKAWGVSDFVQFAQECTRHIYYDLDDEDEHDNDAGGGGDTGDGGGGDQNGSEGSGERPGLRWSKRIHNQAAKQEKARIVGRLARDTEDGQAGDVADMIMGLWVQNAKKCPRQEHAMTVDRTRRKSKHGLNLLDLLKSEEFCLFMIRLSPTTLTLKLCLTHRTTSAIYMRPRHLQGKHMGF
jgi:hypothetical protein